MAASVRHLAGYTLTLTGVGAWLYAALDARAAAFATLLVVSSLCVAFGRRLVGEVRR